ncbi:MAG: VIT1/CCC1 transporter family protein [Cyclobacteriaceae bacterium]|nr:VIT1/CCC1 transporter family protein [Cyclobacteriaceae bacterium]
MDIEKIYQQQKLELTDHFIYLELAGLTEDKENAKILREIAAQELEHYYFWKNVTGKEAIPDQRRIKKYRHLAKTFGLSFALRFMEQREVVASEFYDSISESYPEALRVKQDEEKHEERLIGILNDYRLTYAGAIVLGLNDALVEFTGTLAGLTFAFANNLIVGSTGLVMGVAASLSMAASGYLASKEDNQEETNPVTSAIYTGSAYIITVVFLVLPYFLLSNPFLALGIMLVITIGIIASYTYYISVAKAISFKKRFVEMALISLGVAVISFGIGMLIKHVFGIEV